MNMLFPKMPARKRRRKHPASIVQVRNGYCYLCGLLNQDFTPKQPLHEHHIFGGPNRKLSEEYGLKIYLCLAHHTEGPEAAHRNGDTMELLHIIGQQAFERVYGSRADFIRIFGKNYERD